MIFPYEASAKSRNSCRGGAAKEIKSCSGHLFDIINAMVGEGNCVLVLLPALSMYRSSQSFYLDLF